MGWSGDTMPVPLGREDFPLIRQNMFQGEYGGNSLTSFNFARAQYAINETMYHLNATNAARHDVINMHGSPGRVYVTINKPNFSYERPLSPRLLADFLQNEPGLHLNTRNTSIKLAICYGAKRTWLSKSAGETLSTSLGRTVWGAKGVTYSPTGSPDAQWVQF
jgi:hypothetical protein